MGMIHFNVNNNTSNSINTAMKPPKSSPKAYAHALNALTGPGEADFDESLDLH